MFLPNHDKLASLEKISEIDESEDLSMSRSTSTLSKSQLSRPQTNKAPVQTSQATLRGSSLRKDDDLYDRKMNKEDFDYEDEDERRRRRVLLTELGEEAYYDNESPKSSDEDEEEEDFAKLNFDIDGADDDAIFMITSRLSNKHRRRAERRVINFNDIDNEKDYETDLEDEKDKVDEVPEERPNSPKAVYIKMCENLNVIPCRYFMAHIEDQKLVLKYHQFSEDELRAMSKPLWNNFNVEKLYLDGNWIVYNGAKYVARMIRKNDFITELSLSDNRLGESIESTKEVCRMLTENCILKKLNLSGNGFTDRDAELIITALEKNRLLKQLDLSHNQLGDESGKFLGQYICSNDTLEVLNISWNNFRNRAAKEIANGLKENVRLKRFDVSFNGFDMEGGKILAEVVHNNNTIENLNIGSTRLNAECAASIANALEQNDSLKILNVSSNPLTTSGALAIIYAIRLNDSCILEQLDISEIPVTKDFVTILKEVKEKKPTFICKHGPVISTSNTKSILYEGGGKVDFEKILASLKNNKV